MPEANVASGEYDGPQSANMGHVFECGKCKYVCLSPQQLRLHAFKVHGVVRVARRFLDPTNTCPACFRRYPTRTQALRPMSCSEKCARYTEVCEEVDPDEVMILDDAENSRLRQLANSGATDCCALRSLPTLQGPLIHAFKDCYKGRPRSFPIEPPYRVCPAEHLKVCGDRCILCLEDDAPLQSLLAPMQEGVT